MAEQGEEKPASSPPASSRSKKKKKSLLSGNLSFFIAIAAMSGTLLFADRSGAPRQEVTTLDGNALFQTVLSASSSSPWNGPETVWAVFFYKEYCGACRRVRPFFHALAQTTNASKHLRFAELECVTHRHVCKHAGAKTQPTIKLFAASDLEEEAKSSPPPPPKEKKKRLRRTETASWQGVLIAYEVFGWFLGLQAEGLVHSNVTWPSDEALSEAMRDFKAKHVDQRVERATSGKKLKSPRLYLDAVDKAWRMGLHDAVFAKRERLAGPSLKVMNDWLEALAYALPLKEWRAEADAVRNAMQGQQIVTETQFQAILASRGVAEPASFEVAGLCRSYPCTLWNLFHALLANSDRHAAPHVLKAIHGFVTSFFGCSECADHFRVMFDAEEGDRVEDALDANTWLWRAHNLVSSRLLAEGDATKEPWPTNVTCRSCFKAYHLAQDERLLKKAKNKAALSSDEERYPGFDAGAPRSPWDPELFDMGYVFQFLAETYCFDSDTFVCAAFDDPSRAKKHRRTSQAKAAGG